MKTLLTLALILGFSSAVIAQTDPFDEYSRQFREEIGIASAENNLEVFRSILLTKDYRETLRDVVPSVSEQRYEKYWYFLWGFAILEAAKISSPDMSALLAKAYKVDPSQLKSLPPHAQLEPTIQHFKRLCWTPTDANADHNQYIDVNIIDIGESIARVQISIDACGLTEYIFAKRALKDESFWVAKDREVLIIF